MAQVGSRQFAVGQGSPDVGRPVGGRRTFAVGQEHPMVQQLRHLRQQSGPWPVAVWFVDREDDFKRFMAGMTPRCNGEMRPGRVGVVAGVPVFCGNSVELPDGCPVEEVGIWMVMGDGSVERLG